MFRRVAAAKMAENKKGRRISAPAERRENRDLRSAVNDAHLLPVVIELATAIQTYNVVPVCSDGFPAGARRGPRARRRERLRGMAVAALEGEELCESA
jgi:hypothetical protein